MEMEKKKKRKTSSKIGFFKNIIGWKQEQNYDTADQSLSTDGDHTMFEGIRLFSLCGIRQFQQNNNNQNRWARAISHPYTPSNCSEITKLIWKDIYYPKKVMPWLTANRTKITVKFYTLKHKQMISTLMYPCMSGKRPLYGFPNFNAYQLETVRMLLIMRQDIVPCPLVLHAVQSMCSILTDCPVMVFQILNNLLFRGCLLPFATADTHKTNEIVYKIEQNILKNCPNSVFISKKTKSLTLYIRYWIESFWKQAFQTNSHIQIKMIYYLLIKKVNIQALSRICQAIVMSLSRILVQNSFEKTHYTLLHPLQLLDQQVFEDYLFGMCV